MPGKLNTKWHESHRMPPRATLDQRVKWHLAHAKACACRDMPAGIVAELKRRGHARAEDVASRGTIMRRAVPVRTHGLTHVALAVRDPQRSLRFYQAVLGVVPVFDQDDLVQAQTPGSRDVLVFERKPRRAGKIGGILHFGFRLRRAGDIRKHSPLFGPPASRFGATASSSRASRMCSSPTPTGTRWKSGTSCRHQLTRVARVPELRERYKQPA